MEAFVYCWTNLDNGCKYIGYHKGSEDDGYICSSRSDRFWSDWEDCEFSRQIIAKGSIEDCVALELTLLGTVDLKSDEYYNNNAGGGVVFTDEIRTKLKLKRKGRKPALGKSPSKETRNKISAAVAGYNHPNAKIADVFDYQTGLMIASNVVLKVWARENGYHQSNLCQTALGKAKQHKGVFAVYH